MADAVPEWERAPFFGQGLGATVTAEGGTQRLIAARQPHNEYVRYPWRRASSACHAALRGGAAHALARCTPARPGAARYRHPGDAILIGCLVNGLGDNTLLYSTTGYAAALILAAALSVPAGAARRRPDSASARISAARRYPLPAGA